MLDGKTYSMWLQTRCSLLRQERENLDSFVGATVGLVAALGKLKTLPNVLLPDMEYMKSALVLVCKDLRDNIYRLQRAPYESDGMGRLIVLPILQDVCQHLVRLYDELMSIQWQKPEQPPGNGIAPSTN